MTERTETGPMQIGDDWPGIFIRGDDALSYAAKLRVLYTLAEKRAKAGGMDSDEAALWERASNLADLLNKCRVEDHTQ